MLLFSFIRGTSQLEEGAGVLATSYSLSNTLVIIIADQFCLLFSQYLRKMLFQKKELSVVYYDMFMYSG